MVRNQDDMVHILGREYNITEEITFENPININEDFKDSLLANLYSTVELLKSELAEKNNIIKSLFRQTEMFILKESKDKNKNVIETRSNQDLLFNNSDASINSLDESTSSKISDNNTSIITKDEYIHNSTCLNLNSATENVIKEKLDNDIISIRRDKHAKYNELNCRKTQADHNNTTHKWPKNTLLIISDSIMNQIDEKRLSKRGINVKLRAFSGSTVNDMHDYVKPLLKKEPDYILMHVGSNDTPFKSADIIFNEILVLRDYIQETLPNVKIIISEPIMRMDNRKANTVINLLVKMLQNSDVSLLVNTNINETHLGRKGLHLNGRGNGRLALNIMFLISQL